MDGLYQKFGKRMFDIFFSIIVIIILSPIFFLTSILILLEDGYPIFFQQDRYGAKRIIFILYKFRSMPINTPDLPSALMKGVSSDHERRIHALTYIHTHAHTHTRGRNYHAAVHEITIASIRKVQMKW